MNAGPEEPKREPLLFPRSIGYEGMGSVLGCELLEIADRNGTSILAKSS